MPAANISGPSKCRGSLPTVAFGGPDKRTLYSTEREGLYGIKALWQRPDRVEK